MNLHEQITENHKSVAVYTEHQINSLHSESSPSLRDVEQIQKLLHGVGAGRKFSCTKTEVLSSPHPIQE